MLGMASSPLHVIWVFGDQHRAQALSCAGDPNVHTPNIDRLATEGVYFTQAVMGTPLCCPCRGSLLTGEYPHRAVPGHECRLSPELPTIGSRVVEAGHEAAWFGKWHVDGFRESEGRAALHTVPRERRGGFSTWRGYENNNAPFDSWVHGHEGGEEIPHQKLPGFESDALTDHLIAWLEKRPSGGAPFFAGLSVQPPHDPYIAPEEWMQKHSPAEVSLRPNVPDIPAVKAQARRQLAGYSAMIENLDWNVGRILEALDRLGLKDSTAILFFSDHGDMHGSHGRWLKLNPYEEVIRVPMIFYAPQNYNYSYTRLNRTSQLVNHVDLVPTTLGLMGLEPDGTLPGTDFSPVLKGRQIPDKAPKSAYLQNVIPTGHSHSDDLPWRGVVTEDGWKYVAFEGAPYMLFNLSEDPYEQVNLCTVAKYRDKRRELQKLLAEWVEKTGDDFPVWVDA